MSRALEWVASVPWAIREQSLHAILEIAARENESVEAVEARLGRKLDNARSVTIRDGVAMVPVTGPISRYANAFHDVSGGTSVQVLAKDFTTALDDPSVKQIMLLIDSPGGQASGINELSDMVYAAREKKPVKAYVTGDACSAAYWIASAAEEIVIDATATLGSIGVVAVVPDPTRRAKDLQFVSSQSPRKRLDPTTESGRSAIQKEIDTLADVFVESVARNRGIDPGAVLSEYGEGGVMVGREAIAAGLADRIGSCEALLAEMVASSRQINQPVRLVATKEEKEMSEDNKILSSLKRLMGREKVAEPAVVVEEAAPVVADEPEPEPEVSAADATAHLMAELVAERDALRARVETIDAAEQAAKKAVEDAKALKIQAEVDAFLAANERRMGLELANTVKALLLNTKSAAPELAVKIEYAISLLPEIGMSSRIAPGGVDLDAVTGGTGMTTDDKLDATVSAKLTAAGLRRGSPAWVTAYGAEVQKLLRSTPPQQ